jgi:hypothetical protein
MAWTRAQRDKHAEQIEELADAIRRYQRGLIEALKGVVLSEGEQGDEEMMDAELTRTSWMLRYLAIKVKLGGGRMEGPPNSVTIVSR